ncbi:hypothetical protein RHMOL_Rhmol05G0173400 [Rhododendron molle]|uniref:Uncharacterized protein n=1 Tax=Rhododendron molle TaxID=49168 RepID=A0ACC0NR38_RHOML|nr:hypothetical protein RHMOL_Rhmol05G0173400 [Rhododendron molle]
MWKGLNGKLWGLRWCWTALTAPIMCLNFFLWVLSLARVRRYDGLCLNSAFCKRVSRSKFIRAIILTFGITAYTLKEEYPRLFFLSTQKDEVISNIWEGLDSGS